jgi:hypothetical protein
MMTQPMTNATLSLTERYLAMGWALTPLRPRSKAPMLAVWNDKSKIIQTPELAQSTWDNDRGYGVGLVHEFSGTGVIDIDSTEWACVAFAEFGIEINELLHGYPQIEGRPGHGKALFRVPAGLSTVKLIWPPQRAGDKPVTVFELRAGGVQDVLPPSIHPDTGRPYEWRPAPWDMAQIPDVPVELLSLWRDWPAFKPQFEALCPWNKQRIEPPAPVARAMSKSHDDIIGQFNARHDTIGLIEAHGYVQRGKRWLSPTSSTRIAGVVRFDDGKVFSHHASDPLANGHSCDAFDVFCILEHGGDYRAAVRAARDILGPTHTGPSPIEKFLESRRQPAKPIALPLPVAKSVPAHLLTVPGVLGEAVAWIAATAHKPQPLFDVQAALALGSVALARRYMTDNNNWSSLYLLNVGRSGAGKEHAKHAIEAALEAASLGSLVGPGRFASEAGVLSCLLHTPACIAIVDEFGKTLEESSHPNNVLAHGTMRYLIEVFGRAGGVLRPTAYSTAGLSSKQAEDMTQRFVRNPALTLLGMTTPDPLFAAVGSGWVRDGSLNRLLIVHSDIGRQPARQAPDAEVPASVIAWLQDVRTRAPGCGNLAGMDVGATLSPTPIVVAIDAAARALFDAFELDNIKRANELDEEGLGGMLERCTEIAMRVSLIVAMSMGASTVTSDAASWAIEYVHVHAERNVDQLRMHLADSPFERLVNQLLAFITARGARGATVGELQSGCRAYRAANSRMADEAIARLVHADIIRVDETKSARGRPRKAFVLLEKGEGE